jgi:hypothetical protein
VKAFINTRFLNQTEFDSAAPWGAAVVAVELEQPGTYELAVGRKGKPFVRLPFAVGPEPAPPGEKAAPAGAPEQDMRRAVSVDLFKLARRNATLPELPSLAGKGWVSFSSAQPLPDHHVALRATGSRTDAFDSRKLGERSVFGLTLIRPGRYALENEIAGSKAEIVVSYPKRGKTAYRPPDPLQVKVTKDGFGRDSFALSPGQGIVFRFATESRIRIRLVEPDDGPGGERGPSARFSRLTPGDRSA